MRANPPAVTGQPGPSLTNAWISAAPVFAAAAAKIITTSVRGIMPRMLPSRNGAAATPQLTMTKFVKAKGAYLRWQTQQRHHHRGLQKAPSDQCVADRAGLLPLVENPFDAFACDRSRNEQSKKRCAAVCNRRGQQRFGGSEHPPAEHRLRRGGQQPDATRHHENRRVKQQACITACVKPLRNGPQFVKKEETGDPRSRKPEKSTDPRRPEPHELLEIRAQEKNNRPRRQAGHTSRKSTGSARGMLGRFSFLKVPESAA